MEVLKAKILMVNGLQNQYLAKENRLLEQIRIRSQNSKSIVQSAASQSVVKKSTYTRKDAS